jgi:hypothetical protein
MPMVETIAQASAGWTGYFHDWVAMGPELANKWNQWFMVSTDVTTLSLAESWGLRVFHVSREKPENMVECVNSINETQCEDCLLCAGKSKKAKSVWIHPHGSRQKKIAL